MSDLRQRLRPVCRDWGEADFESLVHQIARRKLRWTEGAEPH